MNVRKTEKDATLALFLSDARARVDRYVAACLADRDGDGDDPGRLREAMRYATQGGKRLRPALVLASAHALGASLDSALPAAAAVELLHAYTLVHDDLPAMDDDDERRGQPTVHVKFGEANAILVGDALLTEAFFLLAELGDRAATAVRVLARHAGARALLAGQAQDLSLSAADRRDPLALDALFRRKTGALFAAAAELGAVVAGAPADVQAALGAYGMAIGVAFQHADDLADGDHPDAARAAEKTRELLARARDHLAVLGGKALVLQELASLVARGGV